MSTIDNIIDVSTNNSTNISDDGVRERETFHIYILSFTYGLMMFVLVGHFVWRCQWRRISLSHFKSHVPGDKAFKSKRIRERLIRDFSFIDHLCPEPRLISDSCDPSMLGACREGSTVPAHWYRMKAFDEATSFVSSNLDVVVGLSSSPSSPSTPALPEFLSQLQVQGSLAEGEGQRSADGASLVDQCSDLYNRARHKDGEFGEPQFEEFSSLLKQLQNMISSHSASSVTARPPRHGSRGRGAADPSSAHSIPELKEEPQRIASIGSEIIIGYGRHQHLHEQTSLEPLIATSPDTHHLLSSSSTSWEDPSTAAAARRLTKSVTVTPSRETSTPSRSSQRRVPPPLEMSPLIMDMDSDTPTTGGDEEDVDVFGSSGRGRSGGGVPYVPPETPV